MVKDRSRDGLAARYVPKPNRAAARQCRQPGAVGRKVDLNGLEIVRQPGGDWLTVGRVPNTRIMIITSRCQPPPVSAEFEKSHGIPVDQRAPNHLPGRDVPK